MSLHQIQRPMFYLHGLGTDADIRALVERCEKRGWLRRNKLFHLWEPQGDDEPNGAVKPVDDVDVAFRQLREARR